MKHSPFWRNPFIADPETERTARRRRSYGNEKTQAFFEARREVMRTLYRDGATLEEIGTLYGVTRERVRQIVAGAVQRGTGLDAIRVIGVCRKAHCLAEAGEVLGTQTTEIKTLLKATGHWPAMHRLWEWRKIRNSRRGKISDDELIAMLQRFAAKLGRTPTMHEVNGNPEMPTHTTFVRAFGNWAPACRAAGLTPRALGGAGHRSRVRKRRQALLASGVVASRNEVFGTAV